VKLLDNLSSGVHRMADKLQSKHDVDVLIDTIAAKLRSKSIILSQADGHFSLEIYQKGSGYDIKLKMTT
jgi:hypothetical protein